MYEELGEEYLGLETQRPLIERGWSSSKNQQGSAIGAN